MSVLSVLKLFKIVIFHTFYVVCFAVWGFCERLANFFGLLPKPESEDYCEIRDVILRSRISHGDLYFGIHFLTKHSQFVDSSYVLRDTVLVYAMTKNDVTFVEFLKPVHEVCTVENSVILMCWAFENAQRVIKMPVPIFQKMADKKLGGKITMSIALLGNQARCGSTLLCKALGRMCPRVVCMSEPGYILNLGAIRNQMSTESYQRYLSSIIRFSCRPVAGVQGYFIKMTSMGMICIDELTKVCPEVKFLYLQREDRKSLLYSYHRMLSSIVISRLMLIPLTVRLFAPVEWMTGSPPSYVWASIRKHINQLDTKNLFEGAIYLWAMTVKLEKYLSQILPPYPTVSYEQLLKDPDKMLTAIAEYCGFQAPYNMTKARSAFIGDSQEGTHLSRDALKLIPKPEVTEEMIKRIENFCSLCDLPSIF